MTNPSPSGLFNWLEPHELDAWLGLLAIMQRAFPEIARQLRDEHDMLPVHYHILVSLYEAPDNTLQLTDLAHAADLSPSRLTHRLRTLVDRGDVEVNPDPSDGRVKRATITAQGLERVTCVAPSHGATVRRVIFDHLSIEQSKAIGEALQPVVKSLVEHPEYLNPKSEN